MSTGPPPANRTCCASMGRFLLGVFVVGQLLFLVLGNFVPFFVSLIPEDRRNAALAQPLVAVEKVTQGWIHLTGQGQGWRLFAPEVQKRALFVSVEIENDDPAKTPLQLPSSFEPDASGWYLHLPGSDDRLFHLEKELSWPLVGWNAEGTNAREQEWQEDMIRDQWRAYVSYLEFRAWKQLGDLHFCFVTREELLPRSMILSVRIYPPSVAGQQPDVSKVVTRKLVRWQPAQQPPEGFLPLEVYNEGTERFQFLAKEKKEARP
jgi:hypothetical protein